MEKRLGAQAVYNKFYFAAGAYATSAIRWLTAPGGEIELSTQPRRQVGRPDVEAIREVTQTLLRLDNLFGGGRARPTVVRYLHDEVAPLLREGRYSESVGRELFTAAAELTRLAGFLFAEPVFAWSRVSSDWAELTALPGG